MTKAPEEIAKAIQDLNLLLHGPAWPCDRKTRCIEAETKRDAARALNRRDGMRLGWHGYDPHRMCPACAASWHVACAYNLALGIVR